MKPYSHLRRGLAAAATCGVVAGLVVLIALSGKQAEADKSKKEVSGPGWRLFGGSVQRNMVNSWDRGVATAWSFDPKTRKGKNVLWVAELGSKAYGGPVIADGKVFIGTNNENPRDPKIKGDKGVLMCFEERTGKFLWQVATDKLAAGRVQDWPREGVCSTPFVEGNRIYYINNRANLVCADTANGKPVWSLDMIGKLGVFPHNLATSSPLVVNDTVFVVTSNGVDEGHINIPRPQAPSFLAVNKNTGAVIWQNNEPSASLVQAQKGGEVKAVQIKNLVNTGKLLMHGQWSNATYAEAKGRAQAIFPGGDGWIYSFNPKNGHLLWKFNCNPPGTVYELGSKGTRSDFLATPVVYEDKLYIGTGQDPEHEEGVGHLWCIDITKKPTNKEKDVSPVFLVKSSPQLEPNHKSNQTPKTRPNPDSAQVWHFGGMVPSDQRAKLGRNWYFGRTLSTCAVHDGLVYAVDLSGYLVCLDAATGKLNWDHAMGAQTWCSPYWVDGKIYMGNDDGVLYIFKHGKEKKLLTPDGIEIEGKIRATPVVANGILYLMTENKLLAIKG